MKDVGKIVEKEETPNFIEMNKRKLIDRADEIRKLKEGAGAIKKPKKI